MSWHRGRMVACDVETTGTDPNEARIVTACVALVGDGEETRTREWIADPGVEIPAEAAAVHGVTTERAQAEGRPAAEVVAEMIDLLATEALGRPLVVFNARYDLTVLDREARRYGLVPLHERVGLFVVDPLVIDRWLDRYRRGSRKLDAMCAHYGAVLEDAHDAAADAVAAARLAWCLAERGKVQRRFAWERAELAAKWEEVRHDLALLHAAQCVWAREQAESLQEYFDRKGQDEYVAPEWPVLPVQQGAAA